MLAVAVCTKRSKWAISSCCCKSPVVPGGGSIDGVLETAFPAASLRCCTLGCAGVLRGAQSLCCNTNTVICNSKLSQNTQQMEEDTYKMEILFNLSFTGAYTTSIHKCKPRPFLEQTMRCSFSCSEGHLSVWLSFRDQTFNLSV